jgi:UDP-N-acetylmuramyl tripeptide synthase
MGAIAARLSDLVIITSDNPRTEEPMDIIEQITAGIGGYKEYAVEPDRRKAIYLSINLSRPGDTILIAGKGHETYQIIGSQRLLFDDSEAAEAALKAFR